MMQVSEDNDWEHCFDEITGQSYWWNCKTSESSWTYPKETSSKVARIFFQIPSIVPSEWTIQNMKTIFHCNSSPSSFIRVHVLETKNPLREALLLDSEKIRKDWTVKLIFFAYKSFMPNTIEYEITHSKDQYRTRLLAKNKGRKARFDVSKWLYLEKSEGGLSSFYAYPMKTPDCTQFSVDYEASPDRYFTDSNGKLHWKRNRCFSFCAFKGAKFCVFECKQARSYRIVEQYHFNKKREVNDFDDICDHWTCILAFYAFKDFAPGTQKYFVQESHEPHCRFRISLVPQRKNNDWKDLTYFYAWDIAMPNTSKFSVQYKIPGKDDDRSLTEQSRIFINDCWGNWIHKLYFYAHPSSLPY